ncbi:MAG: MMPL family transporter, partial [Bacteroidota bacterium]
MFTPRERLFSYITLALTLVFAGWAFWHAIQVAFDYDFERFFPADSPETAFYEDFRDRYGSEADFILIGIAREQSVFEAEFLGQVARLTDSLVVMPGVVQVISPTNLQSLRLDPLLGIPTESPYLNPEGNPREDSVFVYEQPDLVGSFFSPGGQAISLWVEHESMPVDTSATNFSNRVDALVERFGFEETHIAGKIAGQTYYIGLMRREVVVFLSISLMLIIGFLWLAFRSFWGVVVPL